MKPRLTICLLAFVILLGGLAVPGQAQQAASVTWNLIAPDSARPSTIVGNLTALSVAGTDTFVVRDYTGTPVGPLGVTNMRWWPGPSISWGNETAINPRRYVQFVVAPTSGNSFTVDSISIYLLGGGTSNIKVLMYYDKDAAFPSPTRITADTIALANSGSASPSRYAYSIGTTVNSGQSLYIRIYPWYTGAASTSKYLITQLAVIKGTTTSTSGVSDVASRPLSWQLSQNYPNPFNPSTVIEYQLAKSTQVKVAVYDLLGNEVQQLVNREESAGPHAVKFSGSHLASGLYFYRIQAGDFTSTRKMLLTK